ncbi:MAG: thermonuclease family protein [Microgenomates group bacterium]
MREKINKNLFLGLIFYLIFWFLSKNLSPSKFTQKNNHFLSPTLSPIIKIGLTPSIANSNSYYLVKKVVDGDTLDVEIDNQIKRVRVIGINTPEVVDPRKTVECFGKEASNKAKEILAGKKVKLEADLTQGNTDKYGRLLRYVFLEDGTDFGLLMIKEGYAYEYTYNIPYKYQQKYKEAQKEAQENKKGLWGDGVCF